ncbi:ABC transporter ATP-binding protein [Patescibacteria group bacterium]|nr:MAG: ABC transporter ATP-binding protein [Patescibacteria group bacterium]
MKNIIKVFGYVRHIKRYMIILALLGLGMSLLNVIQPYIFKVIVDELVRSTSDPSFTPQIIWYLLGGLLVLRIFSSVINYFNNIYGNTVYLGFVKDLRQTILAHVTKLSIDYFEKSRTGAVMQRATGNSAEIANWFYNSASNILGQILSTLLALSLIFFVSWPAGLLVLVGAVLFYSQQIPVMRKYRPIGTQMQKAMERSQGYVQETIAHIATVRSFGGESGALKRHLEALTEWGDLLIKRDSAMERNVLLRQFTISLTLVGAVAIVAYGAVNGYHTTGDILLISLYVQQISGSLWPLGRFYLSVHETDITAERIVEMLETPPTVVDAPNAKELTEITTVEFKNVSFKYPGKRKLTLNKVSFKVEPGQTLALVGPSGTGKTTVTKLLLRFYDVSDGAILINGTDIREFTQESLRRHMGVVMQDVALFNDTVEANLQLARPEATSAEVRAAAKQAHASVFINKLSEKYQTLVGERGVKLSGGEKQRVAIARAILKQPQLIILDEATSALDSESEQQVQAGLQELMQDRTAIVIAHRLSTIMGADQIVVMKDGAVAETGNHDSLSAKQDGLYAKLVSLQRKGFVKG